MKNLIKLFSVFFMVLLLAACDNDKVDPGDPEVKDNVSFALDIQPILTAECATCHNPTEVEPDFREDLAYASIEELIEEGEVIPGNAEESELVEMLEFRSEDGNSMPPAGPLTPTEIALIKKWIDEGAKDN
ncbi:MAG: c-type cytochrome domain-containing protein [Cyclobacteriaceae bacterium]